MTSEAVSVPILSARRTEAQHALALGNGCSTVSTCRTRQARCSARIALAVPIRAGCIRISLRRIERIARSMLRIVWRRVTSVPEHRPSRPDRDTLASVLIGAIVLVVIVPWLMVLLAWAAEGR